jgi:hypothetical protein
MQNDEGRLILSLQLHQLVIARGLSLSLRGLFPKQSVYYEIFRDVRNAISREKQIKGGSRAKKIELINEYRMEGSL